jgi:hypothetical protein
LASYPPPFSPGNPTNLSFATLSIFLYFLIYSSLLLLDSSYISIPSLEPYILLNIFPSKFPLKYVMNYPQRCKCIFESRVFKTTWIFKFFSCVAIYGVAILP